MIGTMPKVRKSRVQISLGQSQHTTYDCYASKIIKSTPFYYPSLLLFQTVISGVTGYSS